jgi:1-deoxyxylulose-5-phosphate synthase
MPASPWPTAWPADDFQGISDEAELQKIRDQIPGYANA